MRRIDRQYSAKGRRRASSRAGFTLIELLVVILLILIIALISTPFVISQISRARVTGAAQQSMSLLQRTRLEAIRRSQDRAVTRTADRISGGGAVVSLEELDIELWDEPLCYDPDNDGTADYSDAEVTYDAQGKASAISAFCLTDGRGNIFQIAVDSLQGSPRIRKLLQPGDSPTGNTGFFLDKWVWY